LGSTSAFDRGGQANQNSYSGIRTFEIVCVGGETDGDSTLASGFRDEAEAWETAETWIRSRFVDAAYDHSKNCWWLLDSQRHVYRIMIHASVCVSRASPVADESYTV
jgi:hypothetical protein